MANFNNIRLGFNKFTLSAVAMVILILACTDYVAAQNTAEPEIPQIISSTMRAVGTRVYPRTRLQQQSGEKRIVSALLYAGSPAVPSAPDESRWLTKDFELQLDSEAGREHLCVDFSNGSGTVRVVYLLKVLPNSGRLKLKLDYPQNKNLLGQGGTFVAYPANSGASNVDNACASTSTAMRSDGPDEQVVFPAQVELAKGGNRRLYFKINSGGAEVSLHAQDSVRQDYLAKAECKSTKGNGTYDRECSMDIDFSIGPHTRFMLESSGPGGYRALTLRIPE